MSHIAILTISVLLRTETRETRVEVKDRKKYICQDLYLSSLCQEFSKVLSDLVWFGYIVRKLTFCVYFTIVFFFSLLCYTVCNFYYSFVPLFFLASNMAVRVVMSSHIFPYNKVCLFIVTRNGKIV